MLGNEAGVMVHTCVIFLICVSAASSTLTTPSLNVLGGCFKDYTFLLDSGVKNESAIKSPGYAEGKEYDPGTSCKWIIEAPNNNRVQLDCEVNIPESVNCSKEGLLISTSGDIKLQDAKPNCGSSSFTVLSENSKIAVSLNADKESKGGKFICKVQPVGRRETKAVSSWGCNCGWMNKVRIVNGWPTQANQYVFMAGIVNGDTGVLTCGATLISRNYVITAAHCVRNLQADNTAIVLGEHDTNESPSNRLLVLVSDIIVYPYYDEAGKNYDLALIKLAMSVNFNSRIGPVCLPFTSANWDLTGQTVTVLGWGTTEYGGPRSSVLQQTNVNLVDIQECVDQLEGNIDGYTQYCSLGDNTDACQYDSGGPLLWINPNTNRYQLVGVISYGRGCNLGYPSINTRIAPFLQWILDNTPGENYCAL